MFSSDLNLHSYEINENYCSETFSTLGIKGAADLKLAPKNEEKTSIKESSNATEYDWQWLNDESSCKSEC